MPTAETHNQAVGMEYSRKKLVSWVSNNCNVDYYELYEERPESEIWDLLAIYNTNNYSEE